MTDLIIEAASAVVDSESPFTPTGLQLRDDLTFEEWSQLGGTLATMEHGINWWIGDWINYGEHAYGEKYAQAIQETGKRWKTLANIAYVAGRIETSRRRETLSWSTQAEVAALEPAEQERILEEAERKEWGRDEVRAAVRNLRNAIPAPAKTASKAPAAPAAPATDSDSATDDSGSGDEDEDGGAFDLVQEMEGLQTKVLELTAQRDSLLKDDSASEIAKLHERIARLEGHQQREQAKGNERERIIKAQRRTLEQCAQLLGVDAFTEIVPALQELLR